MRRIRTLQEIYKIENHGMISFGAKSETRVFQMGFALIPYPHLTFCVGT